MDQLAGLPDEARTLALDRFRLLQPHLDGDRPLKAVASAAGIPFRTAQRWVSMYRKFGLVALARKKRTDTGQHREVSAKLKDAIEGIALQRPPLPVAAICRQVRRMALDLGEEPPSYWVVYRIVADIPSDLLTLAHEGTKAYSNTFELIHRREAAGPNATWQADHTLLDILLVRPDGETANPWLTTVIDDYSRAVAGYFLSFEDPSSLHTLCGLDGFAQGGAVREKPTLTLAEFDGQFRNFLLNVYHRRENAETKMPPDERWQARGFLPRMPDSLEQLDLLLIQIAKARQVRPDGIHFQNLRYVSTTLAAYVGETVTLRIDPRDMAEVRVFYEGKFLCGAVCAELAGETVPLREILRARNRRRRELRGVLRDRQAAVNTLLDLKRGEVTEKENEPAPDKPRTTSAPGLKRYRNE